MKWMRGRCQCGEDHTVIKLYSFEFLLVGLLIGLFFFFPLGCTHGIGKQKQIEMEERHEQG